MPTTRPRHVLTETDDLAAAIDEAARRWPADRDRPARLLLHLVQEGRQAIATERDTAADARRTAVEQTAGAATGSYGDDYLRRLRDDWPA